MTLTRPVFVCVAGLAACGSWISPAAADPAKRKWRSAGDPAPVERVLRQEVGGVNRREALAEVLRQDSDFPFAHWQAGYVRDGKGWRSFDEAPLSEAWLSRLTQYHNRRAAAPATGDGQRQLANWCGKHELPDQETAHLYAVVAAEPDEDHTPLLKRLGYRRIAGQWLNREHLVEWRELNRSAEASLKSWGPRLERAASQLSGSARQKEAAGRLIEELQDPSAIPAIELTLCGRDERTALTAVETFARIDGHKASIALAKQGVFSKWPAVRQAATRALTTRNFEHFVPELVGLLSTPIQGQIEGAAFTTTATQFPMPIWVNLDWAGYIRGELTYSYVMRRETDEQFQVATFNVFNSFDDYLDLGPVSLERADTLRTNPVSGGTCPRTGRRGSRRSGRRSQEGASDRAAERTDSEVNQRVGDILSAVSDEPPSADAKRWWAWWNAYSERVPAEQKAVVQVASETEVVGNTAPTLYAFVSCFAPGTPVRTETGLRPIEEIRVGDRVLAKDVETGELAYKPVLQTTLGPPKELMTLRCSDATILCTPGHRFWASGSGWTKARDLESATLLHTATGNTPVWSSKKGKTAKTHNLVVADFHTYFVGATGVLCHDVMLPKPTDKIVPGLDRSRIAVGER